MSLGFDQKNGSKSRYLIRGILAFALSVMLLSSPAGFLFVPVVDAQTQTCTAPLRMGTHSIPEVSGAVASRAYPGIYWVHSDSEDPTGLKLYAIDIFGKTVKDYVVLGAPKIDWEDIAIDANNNLWIGDIGDNNKLKPVYGLYKLPEPNPYGSETTVSVAASYSFVYPDGQRRDAEGLFVWQGIPHVVRKALFANDTEVFKVDVTGFQLLAVVEAQFVGKFNPPGGNWISGADISTDGMRLALVSGLNNRQWVVERDPSSTDVRDFFRSTSQIWRIDFNNTKGEGIAFIPGTYNFVVVGELFGVWKATQRFYEGIAPSYTLSFEGYDYNNVQEIKITLNGKVVANLPVANTPANSNAWVSFCLDVSDELIPNGENTLTFIQTSGSSNLRNLIVKGPDGSAVYSDSVERSLFQSNPSVTYTFDPRAKPYTLGWEGFDYDDKEEVTITFDEKVIAKLPSIFTGVNNDIWLNFSLTIWAIDFESRNHTLTFTQNLGSSKIKNLAVKNSTGTLIFSDPQEKSIWSPGNPSVTYTFPGTPPPPPPTPAILYSLSFQGYDFDDKEEVTITLNNRTVVKLPTTWSGQNNDLWVNFTVDITSFVISGNNTLIFALNGGSSKVRNLNVTASEGSVIFSDPTERAMWLPSKPSITYTFKVP